MVFPPGLPIPTDPITVDYYNYVEALPKGSPVAWGYYLDYIASYTGARDANRARLYQLLTRNAKIVMLAYGPVAPAAFEDMVKYINIESFGYKYGTDYVIMPFLAGEESALASAVDFFATYTADNRGNPLSSLPIFNTVKGIEDCKLGLMESNVVTVPHMMVRQWGVRYGVPLVGSSYAEMSIYYKKYVFGCVGSASLFELLVKNPGVELIKSDMTNISGGISIAMIFIGLVYSIRKRVPVKPKIPAKRSE
jgi:hypothetical protein